MLFSEPQVENLDLTCPRDVVRLIVEFFCAKRVCAEEAENDEKMVGVLLSGAQEPGLNYAQFNELLLLLRQNRVTLAFFEFIFGNDSVSLKQLRDGIIRFRGIAMLCFGNFTYARRTLTRLPTVDEIRQRLGDLGEEPEHRLMKLSARPYAVVDIEPISREHTWLNGEITGKIIEKESKTLKQVLAECDVPTVDRAGLMALAERLVQLDELSRSIQKTAQRNTDVYLTWDYLDVYVATSMRNKCEFEEVYDFIRKVFQHELLHALKLRYFDPTHCKCGNPRDKGLLEGLMLKRASCTIYMAQEGDTLGKDSELAATLAQGKPVIVYVPQYECEDLAERIRSYPLDFLKRRLLILDAEGVLDEPACEGKLAAFDPNYESTMNRFLQSLAEHRRKYPFTLGFELDDGFRREFADFEGVCGLLAVAEKFNFDRRAALLQGRHPLAMQVALDSGIANGVLVVRSAQDCAMLLYGLLGNRLELEISRDPENNEFTLLREAISGSPFRVVTDNERLTNSFWNVFGERRT